MCEMVRSTINNDDRHRALNSSASLNLNFSSKPFQIYGFTNNNLFNKILELTNISRKFNTAKEYDIEQTLFLRKKISYYIYIFFIKFILLNN